MKKNTILFLSLFILNHSLCWGLTSEVPKAGVLMIEVPKPQVILPMVEIPKMEVPTAETPKVDTSVAEAPKPKIEAPKVETPKLKIETPKAIKINSKQTGKFVKDKIPYSAAEQASIDYKHAMQLLHNGERAEASIGLQKVLYVLPSHTGARTQLIDYYLSIGESGKVEELLQQGLQLDANEPIYIKQMALLLNENAAYGEALSLLLTMPKKQQDDLDYKSLLALTYLHEGLFSLSQKHYIRLLRVEPRNSQWRLGLALAQDAAGNYYAALENFAKAHDNGGLDSDTLKYIQQRIDTLHAQLAIKTKRRT